MRFSGSGSCRSRLESWNQAVVFVVVLLFQYLYTCSFSRLSVFLADVVRFLRRSSYFFIIPY